ncbi:polysaccharide export protein [Flavobacterium sp. LMO8]|nr:polysaccharide export protein [Flavobacterium sp. LMO8]
MSGKPFFYIIIISCFVFLMSLTSSCVSPKKVIYLQNPLPSSSTNYQPSLQPDDVLLIVVSSETPEVAAPFNLAPVNMQPNSELGTQQQRTLSYVVNSSGDINFPVLGSFKVSGMTTTDVSKLLYEKISKYIANPTIQVRLLNFKVSVLGEVARPGTITLTGERITILEALSQSGDMTIYGDRKAVKVIREENDEKKIVSLDLTQSDFVNSPYYYLKQNDVVYVAPNPTKINSSAIGPNLTVGLTALSLVITLAALIIK